jgi:hypothetical protein
MYAVTNKSEHGIYYAGLGSWTEAGAGAQRELCDLWAVAPECRNLQAAVRC